MKPAGDARALILSGATASLVTGWVSFLTAIIGDPVGYQLHGLAAAVEILLAVSLLSLIGGFIPALLFLWPCFRFARRIQGQHLRFAVAGGIAGLIWFALAWPTRPGSAIWSALIGLSDAPFNLLWLFTGQLLFAGIAGDQLTIALAAAPVFGGATGGLVYGTLIKSFT